MFAGHHSYHLREGWIGKGLHAVVHAQEQEGDVFLASTAPERFGVGPTMAAAMRFWMLACGLIVPSVQEARRGRKRSFHLTDFGTLLWRSDCFLERVESVWLLHIHLLRNRQYAPAWFWFFHSYASRQVFDEQACLDALHSWVIASFPERLVSRATLQKDLLCLLRMYESSKLARSPEDVIASPFARLCLLVYSQQGRRRRYRLLPSDPEHLHPLILLYVLISQQVQKRATSLLVSFSDALYEPGNVGRIIPLLTRDGLLAALAGLEQDWSIGVTRQGKQEYLCLPVCSPEEILGRLY
jgi:hypothetical protein